MISPRRRWLLQLRFIAATLGWWYICEIYCETLKLSRLSRNEGFQGTRRWQVPLKLAQRTCFPIHPSPGWNPPSLSHLHQDTLEHSPFPSSQYFLSQSSAATFEEVKKRQSRTLKSFWKKTFTSTPCLLPSPLSPISPPHHSRHNFWNIFTGISK